MRLDGKILAAPKWVIFFSIKKQLSRLLISEPDGFVSSEPEGLQFLSCFSFWRFDWTIFFPVKHPGQRNSGHPWNPTVVQEFLQCTPGGFDSFWMVFWGEILRNFAQGKQKNLPPPTPKKWVWLHLLSSPKKMVTFNFYSAKSGKMQGEASLG